MVAVCFEDIKESMSCSIEQVKVAIRGSNMGECNKAKDFVPVTSKDPIIKRSTGNAYSRKATLVWLDMLPDDLRQNLMKGKELQHTFANSYFTAEM